MFWVNRILVFDVIQLEDIHDSIPLRKFRFFRDANVALYIVTLKRPRSDEKNENYCKAIDSVSFLCVATNK